MMASLSRRLVSVVAMSSVLAGCAHHPPEFVAANGEVIPVEEEHPTLNRLASICTGRDLVCILAGFALFGGAVAILNGSD